MLHGKCANKNSFCFREVHTLVSSNRENFFLSCTYMAHISKIWDFEFWVIFGLSGKSTIMQNFDQKWCFRFLMRQQKRWNPNFFRFRKEVISKPWKQDKIFLTCTHTAHNPTLEFGDFYQKMAKFSKIPIFHRLEIHHERAPYIS